ncbi:MAG: CDP-2,3-bis-(O-geranylgeranyl)-sn-glycerol synthase [archaeon]|nr:CDP-2,3-bis-(O-geranylgeranyl)-sn-glycerol synthase [archaeon]
MEEDLIIKLIIYLAPMYFANSSAMLFGGKTPIDFGKNFLDGKRLFGDGKTFKGLFFGTLIGTIISAIILTFLPELTLLLTPNYLLLGFLLSGGALIGDIAGSFFKRRNEIKQGGEVLFLDQLDFVIGGMIIGSLVYVPTFYEIIYAIIITLIVHRASNFVAYKIKLKKVPW